MKTAKNGNPTKLVAFFLIATILIITIVLSAGGWQQSPEEEPDSGNADINSGNTDENTDGSDNDGDTTVFVPTPTYINYITGLPESEADALIKPFAFVLDPKAPLYGISSAYLVVEIPTEYGGTRLVAFTNKATEIGKLGSITATRKYISNIAKYFGGILVSYGNDDSFDYIGCDTVDGCIDFSVASGYHYTEYQSYCYTNADLIKAATQNCDIATVLTSIPTLPYTFTNSNVFHGEGTASSVLISYGGANSTELIYSALDGKYHLSKNSYQVTDLLNDKNPAYDNVFVLHADAATYETRESTEMILDTMTSGMGYYISKGQRKEITWLTREDGSLAFLDANGDTLAINPGTSHISFVKSSATDSVIFG